MLEFQNLFDTIPPCLKDVNKNLSWVLENSIKEVQQVSRGQTCAIISVIALRMWLTLFSSRYHAGATAALRNKGFSLLENKRAELFKRLVCLRHLAIISLTFSEFFFRFQCRWHCWRFFGHMHFNMHEVFLRFPFLPHCSHALLTLDGLFPPKVSSVAFLLKGSRS